MGLSSKQVSSGDGLDWGQVLMQTTSTTLELSKPPPPSMRRQQQQQQQQRQLEPLKCPRCDSVNTKFCYYNNYNKSQPRHFCKSCKRHWTKGGTLRNVPVGGGRKNKRLKTSNSTAAATTVDINNNINRRNNTHLAINQTHQHHHQNVPLLLADHQKSLSDILYQSLIRPPYSLQHGSITNSSSSNNNNFNGGKNNGIFMGSSSTAPLISLPQEPSLQFPFSSSSTSFESNPSSISTSFQSSNVYNYIGKSEAMEDSTITHLMPTTAAAATTNSINITHHQPWQHVPITTSSAVMDMPASYWNWDDINTFVSTDLNLQWDDFEVKP